MLTLTTIRCYNVDFSTIVKTSLLIAFLFISIFFYSAPIPSFIGETFIFSNKNVRSGILSPFSPHVISNTSISCVNSEYCPTEVICEKRIYISNSDEYWRCDPNPAFDNVCIDFVFDIISFDKFTILGDGWFTRKHGQERQQGITVTPFRPWYCAISELVSMVKNAFSYFSDVVSSIFIFIFNWIYYILNFTFKLFI